MLGALGILGTLIAGLSMPTMFDRAESNDDSDDEDEAPLSDGSGAGESPLSVALAEDAEAYEAAPGDAVEGAAPSVDGLGDTGQGGVARGDAGQTAWWGHDLTLEPDAAANDAGAGLPGQHFYGSADAETLEGDAGDDTLFGDYGDDFLSGGMGDDSLSDGAGNDTLRGGEGNDTLSTVSADGEAARDGQDSLSGGAGDDLLVLSDHDLAEGGDGADVFAFGPGLTPGMPFPGAPDADTDSSAETAPLIEDFDQDEDALVVIWDDYSEDAPPELSLAEDPDMPDVVRLMGDGEVLARVQSDGDVSLDAVTFQAASGLTTLGTIA
ncbi:MAG: hypothetical protein AAGA87_17755 [Pseudomonadota bacterium]